MAQNKKSFLLYADLLHTVFRLPDDKAGELFKLILSYVNDENPDLDSLDLVISIAFEPIRQQLKRDLNKWDNKREKRVESGRLGGLAKASNAKQKLANLAVSVNASVSVNGNEEKKQKEVKVYFPKSSEIESAFKDYLKLRSTHKFTMTDRAINALVKKLRTYSNGDVKKALEIIDNAVVGKWKTFYSLDK